MENFYFYLFLGFLSIVFIFAGFVPAEIKGEKEEKKSGEEESGKEEVKKTGEIVPEDFCYIGKRVTMFTDIHGCHKPHPFCLWIDGDQQKVLEENFEEYKTILNERGGRIFFSYT